MKKTLLIIMAFFTLTLVSAQAVNDQVTIDNITYTVTNVTPYEVEVSGFDDLSNVAASLTIPASVTVSGTSCSVVAVGLGAFSCNSGKGSGNTANLGLVTVSLPSTVLSLGLHSFRDNPNLTTINMGYLTSTVGNVFPNCTSLANIGTLTNMIDLGAYTFSKCHALNTTIDMPIVETIGAGAISGTKGTYEPGGIKEINIPNSVTSIGGIFLGRLWDLTAVQVNWATPLEDVSATNFFRTLDLTNITLLVPAGTKTAYEGHTVWGLFPDANIVEGDLSTLSVDNNLEKTLGFSIYPNPAKDVVSIKSNHLQDADVAVLDVTGRVVLNKNLQGTLTDINISSLSPGLYLFKVRVGNSQFTKRIIKE